MNKLKDAAKDVHKELSSGWTESIYHSALERELSERGIPFTSEGTIPVMYRGLPVGRRRPDMFILKESGVVVVELKAGSSSGGEQLEQYIGLTTDNDNLGEIVGGAVIRFNNDLEYDYVSVSDDN